MLSQQELSYPYIQNLREVYHTGMELEAVIKASPSHREFSRNRGYKSYSLETILPKKRPRSISARAMCTPTRSPGRKSVSS